MTDLRPPTRSEDTPRVDGGPSAVFGVASGTAPTNPVLTSGDGSFQSLMYLRTSIPREFSSGPASWVGCGPAEYPPLPGGACHWRN